MTEEGSLHAVVGSRGTLTVACRGADGPGEVVVRVAGGTEAYIAYSDRPIPRGATVVIYDSRGGRRVDVEPLTSTDN
jgi:hypothetical protein